LSGFQPSRNAMEVKGMLWSESTIVIVEGAGLAYIADTPGDGTFFSNGSTLVCLTLDA
jgi:hypothetical protein